MVLTDTHCHLHFDDYLPDAEQVIKDARTHKVVKMICVGVNLKDSQKALSFTAQHQNIWATVGTHPHEATDFLSDAKSAEKFSSLSKNSKVVAIGEIGLDYFHENSKREDQQKALQMQLELGLQTGRPFVFHVREAWEDFWKIIDSFNGIKGVIHSFSAKKSQLDEILKRGFYVGLNGIMTFTKDDEQLEAAKAVPPGRLLLETDAPFLAPKPYRGQRCEPKHVLTTAEFLANLRHEPLERLAEATTNNAKELFKI